MNRSKAIDTVAEEVRSMAARRRYSQTRIASVLGCSQASVSRLFRGEVAFDVPGLEKLAHEWDVPITSFFGREGQMSA